MWLNPHLEIFTPSTKLNPHLCSGKCPTPPYTAGLDKPSTPSPPGWWGVGRNYVEVVEYGERNIMKNVFASYALST